MSLFNNPQYAKEFAYRTLYNYYKQSAILGSEETQENAYKELDKIEALMKSQDFKKESYYEVTALLNSLVGLLVIPEQNVYDYLSKDEKDLQRKFPTLINYVNSVNYINTYKFDKGEKSPYAIILHIKNSLSHDRIMIYPENVQYDNKESIDSIIFQDAELKVKKEGKWECNNNSIKGNVLDYVANTNEKLSVFSLKIKVEDLEKCLIEIAEYLISLA